MISYFDDYISSDFSENYWFDEASIIASDLLSDFSVLDWQDLEKIIEYKDRPWIEKLSYLLGDFDNQHSINILLKILEKDDDVAIYAISSLSEIIGKNNVFIAENSIEFQNLLLKLKSYSHWDDSKINKIILENAIKNIGSYVGLNDSETQHFQT